MLSDVESYIMIKLILVLSLHDDNTRSDFDLAPNYPKIDIKFGTKLILNYAKWKTHLISRIRYDFLYTCS